MDNNSIQICNLLRSVKKQSELYIGCVPYKWDYMAVHYTADCTEALPLTLLDKTICGVLDVDGRLTMEQIGTILGLNVEDAPGEGRYRDGAEYALLDGGIRSLLDYNMIERDFSDSTIRLTEIGREYSRMGRKFRTLEAQSFKVYFDRTAGNHGKARRIFANVLGRPASAVVPASFKDEQFLKGFIHEQLPDLYDPDRGNSFTNVSCSSLEKQITVALQVGVLYDVLSHELRYVAVLDGEVNKDLSEIISSNAKIQEELEVQVRVLLHDASHDIDRPSQTDFETFVQQMPAAPKGKDGLAAAIPPVMEPQEFWQGLPLLVGEKEKEVFIRGGALGADQCKAVLDLCETHPETNVFLSYTTAEEDLPFKHNLFHLCQPVPGDYLLATQSVTYAQKGYIIYRPEGDLSADMVFRYSDTEIDSSSMRLPFATALLPGMITDTLNYLNTDFDISKRSVRSISHCDDRINVFQDFLNEETLAMVRSKKQEVFNRVKIDFEKTLTDKLMSLIGEVELEEVTKVKELEEIASRVDDILKDGDETYVTLMENGRTIKQALHDRERTIKEELMAKTYIIDTNVLLNDPDILSKIKRPDRVVLSGQVLQELDKKKNKADDPSVAANARIAVNTIKAILGKDKKSKKDKKKFLVMDWADMSLLPEELQTKKGDNFILGVAVKYKGDPNPWMLTSDNIFGITSESLGIPAVTLEDFYKKNGLDAPAKPGEEQGESEPRTYMDVYQKIYKEKGYVILPKFEKECKKYGIDPEGLGFSSFIELIEAEPSFVTSTNTKGVTYINLKR